MDTLNKKFGTYKDKNIVIQYIQKLLYETYNANVLINAEYYTVNDNNYGLPHFISKYLDYMYPPLDEATKQAYEDAKTSNNLGLRSTSEPISISNYYLCSNDSRKLYYGSSDYMNIYSSKMLLNTNVSETQHDGFFASDYFNKNDMPLFIYKISENPDKYDIRNNTIYQIDTWLKDKDVCELDDLVSSFLLGRVIGNKSSREDIAYVQRLLIRNRSITEQELGQWKMGDDPTFDMTQTIINYQKSIASKSMVPNVFVTGYFDPFTEAYALREFGEEHNGILGL